MSRSFTPLSTSLDEGMGSFSISSLSNIDPNLQIANVFEHGVSSTPSLDLLTSGSPSLDLLMSASLGHRSNSLSSIAMLKRVLGQNRPYEEAMKVLGIDPTKQSSTTDLSSPKNTIPQKTPQSSKPRKTKPKTFVETIRETDVLSGRGGKSNHHFGNKKYRQTILEMKTSYRNIQSKTEKTRISRQIVADVLEYGGRFLKLDNATGRYYIMSDIEARKKTSQALRETKELKWL
mmetsp:Transcript_833/g.1199  ORF Transcript_833/g.1199 Transcript_833/m.1199 type:complete len:233 (+) Transcript_833:63-761(+)